MGQEIHEREHMAGLVCLLKVLEEPIEVLFGRNTDTFDIQVRGFRVMCAVGSGASHCQENCSFT